MTATANGKYVVLIGIPAGICDSATGGNRGRRAARGPFHRNVVPDAPIMTYYSSVQSDWTAVLQPCYSCVTALVWLQLWWLFGSMPGTETGEHTLRYVLRYVTCSSKDSGTRVNGLCMLENPPRPTLNTASIWAAMTPDKFNLYFPAVSWTFKVTLSVIRSRQTTFSDWWMQRVVIRQPRTRIRAHCLFIVTWHRYIRLHQNWRLQVVVGFLHLKLKSTRHQTL